MVLVPLQPNTIPVPPRQPQFAPVVRSHVPMARPIQTCALVKPGNRDTYAEVLAGVPDLVPATTYDAMVGNVDPLTQQELASFPEYATAMHGEDAPVAFASTRSQPLAGTRDLSPVAR